MALTVNTKTYNADVPVSSNIYAYHGPAHTISAKDEIRLGRTLPKPTSDFAGMAKGRIKLTRQGTDGTNPLADAILEISGSFPVGMTTAQIEAMIDDVATFAATAAGKAVFTAHDINQ